MHYGERAYYHRRAKTSASADEAGEQHERLGLGAFTKRGRPTLGNRWDTIVYEEGLQSQSDGSQLGGSRPAVR